MFRAVLAWRALASQALALCTATRGRCPLASSAAMAEARVQPAAPTLLSRAITPFEDYAGWCHDPDTTHRPFLTRIQAMTQRPLDPPSPLQATRLHTQALTTSGLGDHMVCGLRRAGGGGGGG